MKYFKNNQSNKRKSDIISKRLYRLQRNVFINNPELYLIKNYEECLGDFLMDTLSRTELANTSMI